MDDYTAELLCSILRIDHVEQAPEKVRAAFDKFKFYVDRLGGGDINPQCVALLCLLYDPDYEPPAPRVSKKTHGTTVRQVVETG